MRMMILIPKHAHLSSHLLNEAPVHYDIGICGLDAVILAGPDDELAVGLQVVGVVIAGAELLLPLLLPVSESRGLTSAVTSGLCSAPLAVLKVQKMVVVRLLAARVVK